MIPRYAHMCTCLCTFRILYSSNDCVILKFNPDLRILKHAVVSPKQRFPTK